MTDTEKGNAILELFEDDPELMRLAWNEYCDEVFCGGLTVYSMLELDDYFADVPATVIVKQTSSEYFDLHDEYFYFCIYRSSGILKSFRELDEVVDIDELIDYMLTTGHGFYPEIEEILEK